MPSFYPHHKAHQMPLTPPDSGSGYGYNSMHYCQDPYAPHQGMRQTHNDGAYTYPQSYMQPAVAPAPPSYQYSQSGYQSSNSLPPIQNYYEPIGAPLLPPLQISDHISFADDYQRKLQQQERQTAAAREQQRGPTKDEKPTGGVSAKLDYDMEHMTDFVTEATQSMYAYLRSHICSTFADTNSSFHCTMHSQSSFRKWVHQVLSATRLPSATILLSLHYLNDRVANMPNSIVPGENQVYRLLAVALILGSKFLDDNTFINRSWSDVTAIKVTELNLMEMQWLQLISFELHVDPHAHNGLQAWLDAWKEYEATCVAKQQRDARLALPSTGVYRRSSRNERHSPYPSPFSATSSQSFGNTSLSNRSSHYGPALYPSADLWAQTAHHALDDFYKRQHRYPTLDELDDVTRRADQDQRQSAYAHQQGIQSYYQTPAYGSGWDAGAWSGVHRYDCACSSCAYQHYRPYPMASSYSAQTVQG